MGNKKSLNRSISAILSLVMAASCMPTTVFASENDETDEEIRQKLLESVDSQEYPNGLFDFLTPRMETSEDIDEAEFAIVRRGNTDNAASVTFKAVDMTAEYGKDYVIKTEDSLFDKTLPKNEDAQGLVFNEETADDEEATVSLMGDEGEEQAENQTDAEAPEIATETAEEATAKAENQPETDENLQRLLDAKSLLTGREAKYTSWHDAESDADEETKDLLSESYNELYSQLEGVEYTLEFAPGEHTKKLKFKTIDDDISEDEEQVLFVLSNPVNCDVTDNPTGFMNIKDNDEIEPITYAFKQNDVTVSKNDYSAKLVIERKTGINRYGTVVVSTASYTAESGIYYDDFSNEIAFVPGQEYKEIEIPIKQHPASDTVSFNVNLTNNDEPADSASIYIEKGTVLGKATNGDQLVIEDAQKSDDKLSTASDEDISLMDGYPTRSETREINDNAYTTTPGWVSFSINEKDVSLSKTVETDLSMVKTLNITHAEPCEGTHKSVLFVKWTNTNLVNYINVGSSLSSRKITKIGKYGTETSSIELSDSERKSGTFKIGTYVFDGCSNAYGMFNKTYTVDYFPVPVTLSQDVGGCVIQPKLYTSKDNYTNDGDSFIAGKLRFSGESADTNHKIFYNDDQITLEPEWDSNLTDEQKDGLYLWGVKFEVIGSGGTPSYYYYKGDSFNLKDLYNGRLKDSNTGATIDSRAKLTDNGATGYKIYPVFRQKTAFTKIFVDNNKSLFPNETFNNEEVIKTGILDKIKFNIVDSGQGYVIKGFNYYNANLFSKDAPNTLSLERSLSSTDSKSVAKIKESPVTDIKYAVDWNSSIVNDTATLGGQYVFSPQRTFNVLQSIYNETNLNVAINPISSNVSLQQSGAVTYTGDGQTAQFKGDIETTADGKNLLRGDEINISRYNTNTIYPLLGGFADPADASKYKFVWQDFTGDTNRDGIISKAEKIALSEAAYEAIPKSAYVGSVFNYIPKLPDNSMVYYHIVPRATHDSGNVGRLMGEVLINSSSVMEHSSDTPTSEEKPVAGAQINVDDKTVTTDENGQWYVESNSFESGETYLSAIAYGGKTYIGESMVNRFQSNVIDEYNTFDLSNFNGYRVIPEDAHDLLNKKTKEVDLGDDYSYEDKKHLYTFQINELIPGLITGRVAVNRYSSAGVLKKTYTGLYNNVKHRWEVKSPELLEQYKNNLEDYNYSFNPATEGVAAGDYLTIQVFDQNDTPYIEHNIGFSYKPQIGAMDIINTFNSERNEAPLIGSLFTVVDLGAVIDINKDPEKGFYDKTTETERILSFGWSTEFEKKAYDSSKKKKEEGGDPSGEDPAPAADKEASAAEAIKEEAKDLGDAPSAEKQEEAEKTADEAVDKDSKKNERKAKVTASISGDLSVALQLVMGYDSSVQKYYFKDFVVTASLKGNASAKAEYMTPIGITVFVKGDLSGSITAIMGIEPYYQNPLHPDYKYIGDTGSVDLTNMGNSGVDRDLTIYGKLILKPKITLSVGAAVLNDKIANITLSGSADFDMQFSTGSKGRGDVTLSAEMELKMICGLIHYKWTFANEKFNMFKYGPDAASIAEMLSADGDYRNDVVTTDNVDDKAYLANRGSWNGEMNDISLMYDQPHSPLLNETSIQKGINPNAYPKIIKYGPNGSNGYPLHQMIIFLDVDSESNTTTLQYSMFDNNTWSEPKNIDDDHTNDDTPQVTDLGDKYIITWSSAENIDPEASVVDLFNNRNIKSVFFDKNTGTFGNVENITVKNEQDTYSDDDATISYYKNPDTGKESLMASYVKTYYLSNAGNPDDALIGDLLFSVSFIAYRTYDFENEKWNDTYSEGIKHQLEESITITHPDWSSEQITEYVDDFEKSWYGQSFVDMSYCSSLTDDAYNKLVIQPGDTDSNGNDMSTNAGEWKDNPSDGDIVMNLVANNPKIIEHESIACGKYAVSAYIVDLDNDIGTINDRDVFLQVYDFENDIFHQPMRLTDADDVHLLTDDDGNYLTDESGNYLTEHNYHSNLKLVDTPSGASLYYISGGDIVEVNLKDIINNMIVCKANNDLFGEMDATMVNKNRLVYDEPKTVLKSDKNNPYTHFSVNADENKVFVLWEEDGISYKEGIDPTSSDATKDENRFTERQVYVMVKSTENSEYIIKDSDGNQMYYPATDENGNTIDYSVVPDINGEVGVSKAGDPIIQKIINDIWTQPVQMTTQQGKYFSNIDNIVTGEDSIRCVYLKGSAVNVDITNDETGETRTISSEDTANRELIVADYSFTAYDFDAKITNIDSITSGAENFPVNIDVTNQTIQRMNNVLVRLYEGDYVDDEHCIGFYTIDTINGGETVNLSINWDVPDVISYSNITADIIYANRIVGSADMIKLPFDAKVDINNVSYTMKDRNTIYVTAEIENIGNESAKQQSVMAVCGNEYSSSDDFDLNPSDKMLTTFEVKIPESEFKPDTTTDAALTETAEVNLYSTNGNETINVTRTAPSALADYMDGLYLKDTETDSKLNYQITLKKGESISVAAAGEIAANAQLTSSNDCVSIKNDVLTADKTGTARITAVISPDTTKAVSKNTSWFIDESGYNSLPSSLFKTVTYDITVTSGSHSGGGGGGGSSATPTPSPSPQATVKPSEAPQSTLRFKDVADTAWYAEAVKYVAENKLMNGVSDDEFAPDANITRAMFVTVLYRMENEPEITAKSAFTDVLENSYYAPAVDWASEHGIVNGVTDTEYVPDANITREQMAAIMYRYANSKNIDTSIGEDTNILSYDDAESISKYAIPAIQWTAGSAIMSGKTDTTINPLDNATRAETATILKRFIENTK